MKKIIAGIVATVVVAASVVTGIVIYNNRNTNFTASENLMTFSAYSTVSLLSTLSGTTEGTLDANPHTQIIAEGEDPAVDLDVLNDYYNMLMPFLEGSFEDMIEYTDLSAEDENYEVVLQVKIALGADEYQVMTLKYNIGEQILVDTEDAVDAEFADQDINNCFEGVLILGDETYDFVGTSYTEQGEEKFVIRANIDADNYVRMTIIQEENELKYKYEFSKDGVVTETQVKIEQEENEYKIRLVLVNGDSRKTYLLKIETENGEEVTKLIYNEDGEQGRIFITRIVDEITGEVTVEYRVFEPGSESQNNMYQKQVRNHYGNIEQVTQD